MKVFVIEDNPVYNDYVCNLLKKDSFDTMSAYNLATAKKLLAKSEVDDIVVVTVDACQRQTAGVYRYDQLRGGAYGSGKYEARLKGLHTETVLGG